MRVGIDARALASPTRSGVELYVINLLRAISQVETAPEIIAYTNRPITDPELAQVATSGSVRTSLVRARWGWLRFALPMRLRRDRVNVAHFPSTILPPVLPCPAVVTVHDLAWLKFPESYDPKDLAMQGVALNSSARAARVIAVSQTTAHDLEEAGVDGERISVVSLGVSDRFSPAAPPLAPEAFPGAERLQSGYLLSVCRLQARKNLRRLLEAYRELRETTDAPPLVLAGGASEYGRELARFAEKLGLGEHVFFPGQVSEALLPSLYRSATVFAYVSLYEGFGLPVLEAMASGHAGGHRERGRHGGGGGRRGSDGESGAHAGDRGGAATAAHRRERPHQFPGTRPGSREAFLLGTHRAGDGRRVSARGARR